jgi:dihydroflavonol-4-reductase
MQVVITGATGFIGGALARRLLENGADVIGLARLTSDRSHLADLDITWIPGDVLRSDSLQGIFSGVDAVIHAAGRLGEAGVPEAFYQELHVTGTQNVLAEVERTSPQLPRVLYISSPGVLGPISGAAADETAPLAPSNAYERSKAHAEQLVHVYARTGMKVVIARPEFVYGPGDRHVLGLFRAVQQRIFFYVGNGRNYCHPTYIDDAVDGLLLCLENGRTGQAYHICGSQPVTFRELAETMAAAMDVPPPKRELPKPLALTAAMGLELLGKLIKRRPPLSRAGVAFFSEDRRFSWQKAFDELGFSPKIDLETGISRTVSWYHQQGLLEKPQDLAQNLQS